MPNVSLLTPRLLTALEILVGVRVPERINLETLSELVDGGWCWIEHTGRVIPTETGIRATAPMKDISST